MKKYIKIEDDKCMQNKDISEIKKDASRGVFWVVDDNLLAFPFCINANIGVAKSGNTYNHKLLWQSIKPKGCNKPYNYYPRGRVEIDRKGKVTVYMNVNIDESIVPYIRIEFGLTHIDRIIYDHSYHYRCYLDDGWKPEK